MTPGQTVVVRGGGPGQRLGGAQLGQLQLHLALGPFINLEFVSLLASVDGERSNEDISGGHMGSRRCMVGRKPAIVEDINNVEYQKPFGY